MIELSEAAQSVLTRSYRLGSPRVESWLAGQLLSDGIPVADGREEVDRSLRVPERVTLTVPRVDRGESWSPVTDDHPLAANGQMLRVEVPLLLAGGQEEAIARGWFTVHTTRTDGDTVTVDARGMLHLVDEARLVSPYQPSGTIVATLRGLVEPALTVVVDSTLVDRSVPTGINYDEDRLGAVLELLDAWPADAYVTADGYLSVVPADQSTTSVLSLTDGAGGTVVKASGESTRDGAFNAVVARGTASDGGQVQGVAYDESGPKRYGGPFNPLPVPYFFPSPLLTTIAEASAAARTVRDRLKRQTTRTFVVELVPHPGLQAGDVVQVDTDDFSGLCSVETLSLPYTAGGGGQTLTVRSLT